MIVGCVLNMGNAPSYSNFNGLWQHSTVFNGTNHNPPQAHRLSISSWMMIPLILLWKPLAYYYYQWDHHPYGSYIIMVIYIYIFYRLSYSILLLFLSFYCFFKAFSVAFLKWPFFHDGNLGPAQVFFPSSTKNWASPRCQHQRQQKRTWILDPSGQANGPKSLPISSRSSPTATIWSEAEQ